MKPSSHHRFVLLAIVLFANSVAYQANAQSAQHDAQLYFFTNAACGPCRVVEPEIEKLYRAGYSVMKIDTSVHPDWTQRFQVQKTPTVILAVGNKVVARHSGYIDASTMKGWFDSVAKSQVNATSSINSSANRLRDIQAPVSDTVLKGTYQPANEIELRALRATVRLKIDDPLGTSYATGTIIHSVDGEALVLTCGHVFRESQGTGSIIAEFGFADGDVKVARGELLEYDSDARDIALVAISTGENIDEVPLAKSNYQVAKGAGIFSIGCDQGDRPSIRRSKIKNQAKYDGVNKYEIFGRPVNGRSGGGLFTSDGELIGVCNAAVVDVDEGVYVALDTIHWQIAKVNLGHLFDNSSTLARQDVLQHETPMTRLAQVDSSVTPRNFDAIPVRQPSENLLAGHDLNATPVVNNNLTGEADDREMIIILRDRQGAGINESWTVSNPSQALVSQLKGMSTNHAGGVETLDNRIARLRQTMPNLPQAAGKNYNPAQMRAQSPR